MGSRSGGASRAGRQAASVQAKAERMQESFKKGTFILRLNNREKPEEEVSGDVLGNFGVHKEAPGYYGVTHTPSGLSLGHFNTQRGARAAARYWHVEAGSQSPDSMGREVQSQYLRQFGARGNPFDNYGAPRGFDSQGRPI